MDLDYTKFNNEKFCILVWKIKEGEEKQAGLYGGLATWNPVTESVDVFEHESDKLRMSIKEENLKNIRIVGEKVKSTMLGADYGISFTLQDLPNGLNKEELIKTGIIWN